MKKFFLFAAAAVAALTVNAKVVTFANIVDKTSAETAKSSFDAGFEGENIVSDGVANSQGTAYAARIKQVKGTSKYDSTFIYVKGERQVYLTFKDASNNKEIGKTWNEYFQPNSKTVCLVVKDLVAGDKVRITLKKALDAPAILEGVDGVESIEAAVNDLTATGSEIRLYSKDADNNKAAWQLISVSINESTEGVDNIFSGEKAEKFFRDGQLIIRRNGVEFNALGVQL